MKQVDVFVLAGIWTAPDFMENAAKELARRYQTAGWSPQATLLYPYGDWSLGRIKQLREIGFDLFPRFIRRGGMLGGRRAADAIKPLYRGGELVIIGHSGGGVAAVHAAQLLAEEEGWDAPYVVQIGSPKCPVPRLLKGHVVYVAAIDAQGRWKDPVTRLGRWRQGLGRPAKPRKLAVPAIREVAIKGGHADYFRDYRPYIQENVSNLEMTIESFWRDIQ